MEPSFTSSFLQQYYQYSRTVLSRPKQLQPGESNLSTEDVKPVGIKFCEDTQRLSSVIDLGFIEGANSYKIPN